jgi:anti-sigma factor RsiW
MNGAHVGDNIEAYALGVLDDTERAAVDAHIAGCDECLQLVGRAEETVASLTAALPRLRPPAGLGARLTHSAGISASEGPVRPSLLRLRAFAPLATAAALALALGGTLVQNQHMRGELTQEDAALTHVVHAHFLHVTMTPGSGETVSAKVIFARDGSWIYVLADRPPEGVHVVATVAGVERDLGPLVALGAVSSLFADVEKPSAVTLRDGARTIASAPLSY